MIQELWQALLLIIFPRSCAGCGTKDTILCKKCMRLFDKDIEREIAHSFMAFSCAYYEKEARSAILSWKDHGDEELDSILGAIMARRCIRILEPLLSRQMQLCIVPVPSSPSSIRHRRRAHMIPIAREVARRINTSFSEGTTHCSAHVCPILSIDKRVHKAVTASGKQNRLRRLDRRLQIKPCTHGESSYVILMDDIVTTGATLRSCVRMLRLHGKEVIACCALCDAHTEEYLSFDSEHL
ncbi:ComF family protein [Alloscardovia theropitheci]|uniref:ComF family protein n=1 Tax=Alloscardovia theropitheci TaxID=2496842 RepID=A0A4R0QSY8_9BIFI|nr:phosphoribosyltransferase family protein [Alloscardovia theropitheci]TCD54608.1 ComF family protein [Alloscardovia theropitheci]